jgi:hypothetical protein
LTKGQKMTVPLTEIQGLDAARTCGHSVADRMLRPLLFSDTTLASVREGFQIGLNCLRARTTVPGNDGIN